MPDTHADAPSASEQPAMWLPVGEVAARLGVSPRSIQRRCTSARLPARRVQGERGPVWEVRAEALEASGQRDGDTTTATATQKSATATARRRHVAPILPFPRLKERDSDGDRQHDGDGDTRQSVALSVAVEAERLRAQLEASRAETERERELNRFLKSQIEEGNRNAAELRAALRKALEIAPRQLAAPTATATNGQQRDHDGAANNVPIDTPDAPELAQNGQHDADELGAAELLEMCRRISQ